MHGFYVRCDFDRMSRRSPSHASGCDGWTTVAAPVAADYYSEDATGNGSDYANDWCLVVLLRN